MIGHGLMHVKAHSPAKGRCQIDTLLPIVHIWAQIGCYHFGSPYSVLRLENVNFKQETSLFATLG